MKTLSQLFIATRPLQWVKNFACFAALIFGGKLLDQAAFQATITTFIAFCLVASSSYFFNDLIDAKSDLFHKTKKKRPIASGQISRNLGFLSALVLSLGAVITSLSISFLVFLMIVFYLVVQFCYNFFLKKIILLEILIIALGFIIRVFAGSLAINVSLSSWLILAVMMLSLFLAIGKRRSEINLLGSSAPEHRQTLASYPLNLLDGLVFLSATSTLITYSLFTFNQPIFGDSRLLSDLLPQTFSSPKWLMLTIPVVVYGIFRYLYLIFEQRQGESPEKILLSDRPLLTSVLVWFVLTLVVVYLIPTI